MRHPRVAINFLPALARAGARGARGARAGVSLGGHNGFSGPVIRVDITPGPLRIKAGLQGVVRKVMDLRIANARVADFLLRWVHRNFDSEGRLVGGWTPFKSMPSPRRKLLNRTGRLRSSFRKFSNERDARVNTRNTYARYHNEGTRTIPRRPLVPFVTASFGQAFTQVTPDVMKIYNTHAKKVTGEPLW